VVDDFRALLQAFVRQFGLLSSDRTPCGKPVAPSDAHALMILREGGDPGLPQASLAQSLGVDKSTASRLVARLTESGHLAAADSDDGRVRAVRLTKKGVRLAEEIDQASRARFAALLDRVPAERRARVVDSLRDVVAALDRLVREEGEDQR
jgi:DNA-binding MarR family transcriptional regulator